MAVADIILVFADTSDDEAGERRLVHLPAERKAIRDCFHYDHRIQEASTFEELETHYRETQNPRILHFSGHGNAKSLKLPSADGDRIDPYWYARMLSVIKAHGVHRPIQLLFLNACDTNHHIDEFLALEFPVIIHTTRPVYDKVAKEIARLFYQNLVRPVGGKWMSVERVFHYAINQYNTLHSRHERDAQAYYRGLDVGQTSDELPYKMAFLRGDESYKRLTAVDMGIARPPARKKTPRRLYLLCDRDKQVDRFRDKVLDLNRTRRNLPRPHVFIVPGYVNNGHHTLEERFAYFLNREWKEEPTRLPQGEWEEDPWVWAEPASRLREKIKRETFELCGLADRIGPGEAESALPFVEKQPPRSVVFLRASLHLEYFKKKDIKELINVLEWFIDQFWRVPEDWQPKGRNIFVFVKIKWSEEEEAPPRGFMDRLTSLFGNRDSRVKDFIRQLEDRCRSLPVSGQSPHWTLLDTLEDISYQDILSMFTQHKLAIEPEEVFELPREQLAQVRWRMDEVVIKLRKLSAS